MTETPQPLPLANEDRGPRPSKRASTSPILIAAGGSGGHVIPAQAVAIALRRRWPELRVEFVCGMRPVELRAYWDNREQPYLLRCGKAPGSGLGGLRRWMQMLGVVIPAHRLVAKLAPRVVLGMGGYIAAPVLLAARRSAIPLILHDSNAVPGRTTRLFSRWAKEVLLAYPTAGAKLHPRTSHRVVGTPVRPDLFDIARPAAAEVFDLDPTVRTLLVLGGSQGARGLNTAVHDTLKLLDTAAARFGTLQVLWSAGVFNATALSASVERMSFRHLRVRVLPTIERMDAAYAVADLVVSRAGAGTLAEIAALGLPSILVPYPYAKDDHQRHNAVAMVECGAALLYDEKNLAAPTGVLAREIERLFTDSAALRAMAVATRTFAVHNAADEVADTLVRVGYPELASAMPSASCAPPLATVSAGA